MQFHGNPIARDEDPMFVWRIKSQGNEEARQQFLEGYVPQIWELGLTVPDPNLRRSDDGVWEYSEPDWAELKSVVTGHGPRSQERLEFRRALPRPGEVGARRVARCVDADLRGVPPGEEGAAVRARRLGRGARRRVRAKRGRASSTAGAARARRSGSCRASRCTRSPTGRTSST